MNRKTYPGMILSEAMYVREIEAPPVKSTPKVKFQQHLGKMGIKKKGGMGRGREEHKDKN